jgi:hypothetical protein
MGHDERDKAAAELKNILMILLEHHLVDSKDVAMADWFLDKLVPVILIREKGYKTFLSAIMEGSFHLEKGGPYKITDISNIFIPDKAVARANPNIVIEKDFDRYGYIIRRKD